MHYNSIQDVVMKILIIGGGNMGMTYAKSFINAHIVDHQNLLILEKSSEKAERLKEMNIGQVYGEPDAYIQSADLIVLAVKPQDFDMLSAKINGYIDEQQVVLSIMAGVKIDSISDSIGTNKIIRAMPNLPAQIGSGMTVFNASSDVTRIELVTVQNLINATGKSIYVEHEQQIDAATAISGSGPAYVFYFMNAVIDTARAMGFNESEAELLCYQTFKGTVDLFKKEEVSCQEWISKVASRGGTTEAALSEFEKSNLNHMISKGLHAALNRANELSQLMQ